MLAEMNLPMVRAQANAAALAAKQEVREAQCARDIALRDAQLARRDAERARSEARRTRQNVVVSVPDGMHSIVLRMDNLPEINQRIQIETNALQQRIVAQQLKIAEAGVETRSRPPW